MMGVRARFPFSGRCQCEGGGKGGRNTSPFILNTGRLGRSGKIQTPLHGLQSSSRKRMSQRHPRADLKIRDLGVEELLGKGPFRFFSQSGFVKKLMAEDHPRILRPMLEDQVLTLRQFPKSFKRSEGDEGSEPALFDSTLAVPFPEIGVLRVQGREGRQSTVGEFKCGDL